MLENIAGLCVLYEAGGNSIFFTVLSLLGYAMDDINVTINMENFGKMVYLKLGDFGKVVFFNMTMRAS